MQDRYAGDVGDFLKFGLLRQLCEPADGLPGLRLGVVWYLTPDEGHNADGKHTGYLDETKPKARALAVLDPDLYRRLQRVVVGERSVAALETAGVLPGGSSAFGEQLSFADLDSTDRAARTRRRDAWVAKAVSAVAGAVLVFVDPDNGLRRESHPDPPTRSKAIKHAYHHELRNLADNGRRSVVAYHHADRTAPVAVQAQQRLAEAADAVGLEPAATVIARRGATRLFLVLVAERHRERIQQRLGSIERGSWGAVLKVTWPEDDPNAAP